MMSVIVCEKTNWVQTVSVSRTGNGEVVTTHRGYGPSVLEKSEETDGLRHHQDLTVLESVNVFVWN